MKLTRTLSCLAVLGASAKGAISSIPDLTVTGNYNESNSLGFSISGDSGVYMVGTMTVADVTVLDGSFNDANMGRGTTFNSGVGNAFGGNSIVIAENGTRGTAPETFASGVPALMDVKYDQTTGEVTLWVDLDLGATEAANTPSASATLAGVNGSTFDSVIYRGGDFNGEASEISYTNFSVYNGVDTPFAPITEPS